MSERGNCRLGDYGLVVTGQTEEAGILEFAGSREYMAPEVGF